MIAVPGVADDVPPDIEIALRDTGIGRQHEQHRMRVRHQRQRQLRLGTDRVQTRRVENDQAVLQQRMRKVDDRVAPL